MFLVRNREVSGSNPAWSNFFPAACRSEAIVPKLVGSCFLFFVFLFFFRSNDRSYRLPDKAKVNHFVFVVFFYFKIAFFYFKIACFQVVFDFVQSARIFFLISSLRND